jgi:ABC-type amino acid transport substrate-binding protein
MVEIMKHYLGCCLVLLTISLSLCSCAVSRHDTQEVQKQSLYDRVIQSGKIRCGYVVAFPGCVKDPNTGKLGGIGVDALELVAKKLGLTVDWSEEVGWGTMMEGLRAGRYDVVGVPLWTNPNRAKQAAFSKSLYYSPIFPYGRKGDNRFNGHLEKINSPTIKIATIDGETGQVIADSDFPKASRLSMTQMTDLSQLFLSVATKKADIAFAEPVVVDQYLHNNPGSVENASPNKPVRLFPNCWMFNRDELEFKAMLDTVLDEVINSGAMDKIISKYEPSPDLIYRVALPYQLPK